jgi:ADP-dependent NAD(P)H-hydrate dehydratase / NAD(P)H-hydrate epimerase
MLNKRLYQMKILSAKQLYQAHDITIKNQKISEVELLERAGQQVFNWMHLRMQGSQVKIHIFNGIGNNGGVGLVVSRLLLEHGYNVANYVVNYSKKRTDGFLKNYEKVKSLKKWPKLITDSSNFPDDISHNDIIIDGIFGIGLNRDPGTLVNELFSFLNNLKAFKLAIDIPSGLYSNKAPQDINHVLSVNYTLSFQSPKLCFFLPNTAIFTEQWEVLDIGLDIPFLESLDSIRLISKNEVLPMYQMREKFANKFTYGHSLIIGGSYGKIGAMYLASKSALVTGCGLVTAYVPECGYNVLQSSFPEAMVQTSDSTKFLNKITPSGKFTVVGLGVGMGTSIEVSKALSSFLETNKLPLVIDADAISCIAENKDLLKHLSGISILTPHKQELIGLIGEWTDDFDMLKKVKEFSTKYNCIMVVKAAISMTIFREKVFVNTSGNPALATAGTGDVLMGMITSFVAQGYELLDAAIFGVYLHGRTADIAIEDKGYQSFIASDAIANISNAYLDMFKQSEPIKEAE